jgi:hypothetical protein
LITFVLKLLPEMVAMDASLFAGRHSFREAAQMEEMEAAGGPSFLLRMFIPII